VLAPVVLAALVVADPAHADATDTTIVAWTAAPRPPADDGDTTDALPGVVRVPVAGPTQRTGVALASSAGFGWTAAIPNAGASHDRGTASLAASVRPTSFFAAALRLDGRYDTSTGAGGTSGWVGDPRVEFRLGAPLGRAIRIGAQVGVWFPGSSAPSWVFKATTPDASALVSYQAPDSPITFAARAGFRWDNSVQSAPDADRLALSDRLALGLNQASAVLLGAGVVANVSPRVELLADATWDLLVGSGAPSAMRSPILVSAGPRFTLDRAGAWQITAIVASSPSERPAVMVGAPLVDVEPRISAFAALIVRPSLPSTPATPAAPPEPVPSPPPTSPEAPIVRAALQGRILAEDGQAPIAQAHLVIRTMGASPREATTDDKGVFQADNLEPGPASIDVTAEGFAPVTRTLTLSESPVTLDVSVAKALPSGQVRGLVRDFGGSPLVARIRIEPLDVEVQVGKDGTFETNVAPGAYEVVIHAEGYVDQKRRIVVERDGVTMLNVELRKGH
jgi:hypothetical protein